MKLKHPDILNLIDEKLDQKIRNVKIRTVWNVLKSLTKKGLVQFQIIFLILLEGLGVDY